MTKSNRLKVAICVRGHIRSWHKCKKNIFHTFSLPDDSFDVDWFFDTWSIDAYDEINLTEKGGKLYSIKNINPAKHTVNRQMTDTIKQDFKTYNKNLVLLSVHEFDDALPSHLSFLKIMYLANCSKRLHEYSTGIKYDLVYHIRPDIFYPLHYKNTILPIEIDSAMMAYGINMKPTQNLTSRHNNNVEINIYSDNSTINRTAENTGYDSKDPLTVSYQAPNINDYMFYGPNNLIDLLADTYDNVKNVKPHAYADIRGVLYPARIPSIAPHNSQSFQLRKYGVMSNTLTHGILLRHSVNVDNIFYYHDLTADRLERITQDDPLISILVKISVATT